MTSLYLVYKGLSHTHLLPFLADQATGVGITVPFHRGTMRPSGAAHAGLLPAGLRGASQPQSGQLQRGKWWPIFYELGQRSWGVQRDNSTLRTFKCQEKGPYQPSKGKLPWKFARKEIQLTMNQQLLASERSQRMTSSCPHSDPLPEAARGSVGFQLNGTVCPFIQAHAAHWGSKA